VLPTFFDLDKYVALWRSRFLIHVYHDKFKRGFFKFYSENGKKFLYVRGKKFYDYKCAVPNFSGRFTNLYTVDEEEYKKRKLESLRATDDEVKLSPLQKRQLAQRDSLIKYLSINTNYTQEKIAEITGLYCPFPLTRQQISSILQAESCKSI
jgi:hypothetical protein